MNLVLDASAGFELVLETATGQSLLAQAPRQAEWWVPEHYWVEVSAAIRRAELRHAITRVQAADGFARLVRSTFHRVQVRPLLAAAWTRRGHLTIADALYVILTEQIDGTLITGDINLANSPGLRVPTITPSASTP